MSEYLKKYPWLRLRNLYTGEVEEDIDAMDDFPEGWKIAFGEMMLEDLDKAIKEEGEEDSFVVEQVKEKYGSLRFYTNGHSKKVNDIIDGYSTLSENICVICGKPDVPMLDLPRISPYCRDCYAKLGYRDDYDSIAGESSLMPDEYRIRRFSPDEIEDEIHDVSGLAKRIRANYENRVKLDS